jgi:hypothetical protein
MYENRKMKPAEIVLRGAGGGGAEMEGVNLIGVHRMHIWEYHN